MVAVAILAAVGAIAAIGAAAVALTRPTPEPEQHYTLRPPVAVTPSPAPKPAPVTTTVTAAPAPVAQPPIAQPPAPLTPYQQFNQLTHRDGLRNDGSQAQTDYYAGKICAQIANGATPEQLGPDVGGNDVDAANGSQAVRDVVRAYCPELSR